MLFLLLGFLLAVPSCIAQPVLSDDGCPDQCSVWFSEMDEDGSCFMWLCSMEIPYNSDQGCELTGYCGTWESLVKPAPDGGTLAPNATPTPTPPPVSKPTSNPTLPPISYSNQDVIGGWTGQFVCNNKAGNGNFMFAADGTSVLDWTWGTIGSCKGEITYETTVESSGDLTLTRVLGGSNLVSCLGIDGLTGNNISGRVYRWDSAFYMDLEICGQTRMFERELIVTKKCLPQEFSGEGFSATCGQTQDGKTCNVPCDNTGTKGIVECTTGVWSWETPPACNVPGPIPTPAEGSICPTFTNRKACTKASFPVQHIGEKVSSNNCQWDRISGLCLDHQKQCGFMATKAKIKKNGGVKTTVDSASDPCECADQCKLRVKPVWIFTVKNEQCNCYAAEKQGGKVNLKKMKSAKKIATAKFWCSHEKKGKY